MSILTKIAVVVLVVVALFASPLFIRLATVVPNYRQQYEAQVTRTAVADQTALAERLRGDALANTVSELNQQLERQAREAENREAASRATIANLQTELARRASGNEVLQAAVTTQTNVNQSMRQQIGTLEGSLREAHAAVNQRDKDNLELKAALDEALQERDRLTMVVRVLRETIVEQQRELRAVMAAGPSTGTSTSEPVAPAASGTVNGRIQAVRDSVVSINIGSAHGLQRGARLTISRGSQFVGELLVDEVDIAESIGIIVAQRLEPRQGDAVSSMTR